jgi:hypothetical protein
MTNRRGGRAVLVSLVEHDGALRLSLDDVVLQGGLPALWKQSDHYTSKPITDVELDDLKFDEKELADFGYHILARLHAFEKCGDV